MLEQEELYSVPSISVGAEKHVRKVSDLLTALLHKQAKQRGALANGSRYGASTCTVTCNITTRIAHMYWHACQYDHKIVLARTGCV